MSGRIDREIEEILRKYENTEDRRPRKLRPGFFDRVKSGFSDFGTRLRHVTGGQLMLAGLIAIVFAYMFSAFLPEAVHQWTLIAGAIVFAVGLVVAFIRNRRPASNEVRWRGRVIRMDDRGSFSTRVRGWFHRRDRY